MHEILKLSQKIVPEMIELLEKRYNILRTIYYNQPIGRRILANNMAIGERVVRTEINFLKDQDLIEINSLGMTITDEGEKVIDSLKDFIHEIKGLSEIEKVIKDYLGIRAVIIVPGDIEEDKTVRNELGKASASYLKGLLKDESIIALTGGTSIKAVIDNVPRINSYKGTLVVPARGGMGKLVESQANFLAANLANKLGSSYKLLHVPDNLSNSALSMMLNEKEVKEVIGCIKSADILLYGIGRADEMARRRGLSSEQCNEMLSLGAVGEAFGHYFNNKGKIVYSTPTIGVQNEDIHRIKNLMAVAAGKSKAEAIVATEMKNSNSVLITDESAAREIINIIDKIE